MIVNIIKEELRYSRIFTMEVYVNIIPTSREKVNDFWRDKLSSLFEVGPAHASFTIHLEKESEKSAIACLCHMI